MTKKILVLNGPNLNLLGTREPDIYGTQSLRDIEGLAKERGSQFGLQINFRQSNFEGELIEWIQKSKGDAAGIIINAGGLTHTSIAIVDALIASELPVIEVHLSNLFKRENFRHQSYISAHAIGLITGFGGLGYLLAIDAMAVKLNQ